MRVLFRFLAIVCAIVVVPVTIAVVYFHPLATRALRAEPYKTALRETRVYEKFPALAAESFAQAHALKSGSGGGVEPTPEAGGVEPASPAQGDPMQQAMAQLDRRDWEILFAALVPAEFLRTEVERLLDAVESAVHNDGDLNIAPIPLAEVKRRLTGPEAEGAYIQILSTRPACTPEQFEAAHRLPLACRPTAEQLPAALERFDELTTEAAATVPDAFDLAAEVLSTETNQSVAAMLSAARARARLIEMLGRWSIAVPVGLALLIALLVVRSVRGLLLWWGVPALIAGAFCALVTGAFFIVGEAMVDVLVLGAMPTDGAMVAIDTFMGGVNAAGRELLRPVLWTALILAGAGAFAFIAALLLRPADSPAPAPAPATGTDGAGGPA